MGVKNWSPHRICIFWLKKFHYLMLPVHLISVALIWSLKLLSI